MATARRPSLPVPSRGVLELLLIVGAWLGYFGVRAVSEGSAAAAHRHARELVRLERALGIYWEHALQRAVLPHDLLVDAANWVYIWGHWPVIALSALWLFRHQPDTYRLTRTAFFVSGAIGMVIFLSYPVAPPRLAGIGLLDTVTLHSHAYRALQPPSLMDRYAALPSLHFGWDLLIGIALARSGTSRLLRGFGRVMPLLMGVAVVVTANHYVLDVVVGGVLSVGALLVVVALAAARDVGTRPGYENPWMRYARVPMTRRREDGRSNGPSVNETEEGGSNDERALHRSVRLAPAARARHPRHGRAAARHVDRRAGRRGPGILELLDYHLAPRIDAEERTLFPLLARAIHAPCDAETLALHNAAIRDLTRYCTAWT